MNGKTPRTRREKMPVKVLYNLEHMMSPRGGDPKTNIYMGATDKSRVSRDRSKLSPAALGKTTGQTMKRFFTRNKIFQASS